MHFLKLDSWGSPHRKKLCNTVWMLTSRVVKNIKSDSEERMPLYKDVTKVKELQNQKITFDKEGDNKYYDLLNI